MIVITSINIATLLITFNNVSATCPYTKRHISLCKIWKNNKIILKYHGRKRRLLVCNKI